MSTLIYGEYSSHVHSVFSCVLALIESNNVGIATDILCNYMHTFKCILYVANDLIIDNRDSWVRFNYIPIELVFYFDTYTSFRRHFEE